VRRPRAAILVSGSELLDGRRRDTNGHHIASQLSARGATVDHLLVAPDDLDVLVADLRFLLAAAPDLLVVSGGLGSTHDDLTLRAVADALARPLREHPAARTMVEERSAVVARRRGLRYEDVLEHTAKLARLPLGSVPLAPAGLAPGIALREGPTRVYALPGVPHELETMLAAIVDELASGGFFPPLAERVVRTFGGGELQIAAILEAVSHERLEVAVTAGGGEVSVVLRHDPGDADACRQAAALVASIEAGAAVFSVDGRSVDRIVADGLRARGETLATAESCTGGLLGGRVTEVPGSSEVYVGGVVAYSDDLKRRLLDVPGGLLAQYGAVSEAAAAAMAEGVVAVSGATHGLAITGVAGPAGGSGEKPVGLVFVGRAGPSPTEVRRHVFPGDRAEVRRWAVTAALHLLREALSS